MLCQIPDITPGVISLFVSGRISALDYSECLQPLLRRYRDEFGRVKIYIEADVLLEGWETILLPDAGEVQLPQADALVFVGGQIGLAMQCNYWGRLCVVILLGIH